MGLAALRLVLGFALVAGTAFGSVPADPRAGAIGMGIDGIEIDRTGIDAPSVATASDGLTVEGDPGGVDAQRAFARLGELYDRELPAVTVTFRQDDGVDLQETHPDQFFGLLADSAIRIERAVKGAASGDEASLSYRPGASPALVERVLVHELAHAFEPPALREEMESAAGEYADTTDATIARQAVDEGAAVFVTDVYAERYLDVFPQSTRLAYEWPTMTDATRLLWAPYRYGADHARERVSSPATLSVVYEDPPLTTEGLLHPAEMGAERPSLDVESNESVAGWSHTATDTRGELYLRVLLASELTPDRAARAAAGWGTDRLLTYAGEGNDSFALVVRWDSPQDASQFESAMTDYLDAMATRQEEGRNWSDGTSSFRFDCLSGETCYLLAGDPGFVESARVAGNASEVEVSSRVG